MLSRFAVLVPLAVLPAVLGVNLLASHYTGKIYTLSLDGNGSTKSLKITSEIGGCGQMPAWLEMDSETQTVHCIDESWYGSGIAATYSVGSNGKLTQTGQARTSGSSVHLSLFGGSDGKGFAVTSEYDPANITTYKMPLSSSTTVNQRLHFTMSQPGPKPRQASPHPHSAIADPTGDFLIVPDLGADLIRVFSIDAQSGQLTTCAAGQAGAGDGPRHAIFHAPTGGARSTILYTLNELGNSVSVWTVTYPSGGGCMSLQKTQTLSTFPAGVTPKTGSKASEVHIAGNFLYAANRVDESFGSKQDSMATYTIDPSTGALKFLEATSAYGYYPRTFSINKAGTMVAIGGQTSSNVAIVARDTKTGRLGKLIANLQVSSTGRPENEEGLSAVVWAE